MSSHRLTRIDELHLAEFPYLRADDECYYFGEYTVRQRYEFSATNNLVINLKKEPKHRGTAAWKYKLRAIQTCARAFLGGLSPEWLSTVTLVPIPPSKVKSDPEHDDRVVQILRTLAEAAPVRCDVRELITQRRSYDPSHSSSERMKPGDLRQIYRLVPSLLKPPPQAIALVDDVLTTGAHYRAARPELADRERTVDAYYALIYPQPSDHPIRGRRVADLELEVIRRLLGLDPGVKRLVLLFWPSQAEIATDPGYSRSRISEVVPAARYRWTSLDQHHLRKDLFTLVTSRGGVATAGELAADLLELRGSAASSLFAERKARPVVRAGVEGESADCQTRFRAHRRRYGLFVVLAGEHGPGAPLAAYADRLCRRAERLSENPSEAQLLEALRKVRRPAGVEALDDRRLIEIGSAHKPVYTLPVPDNGGSGPYLLNR